MRALLNAGFYLTYFDEPAPTADAPALQATSYRRVPWFFVMEWIKPAWDATFQLSSTHCFLLPSHIA
jgi:hypothetical protein